MGSGTYDVLHEKLRKLVFEQGLTLDAAAERLQNEYEAHGACSNIGAGAGSSADSAAAASENAE